MFNVGGGEILAILVIALIVLGPDKLPNAARQAGKYLNEFRRISSGFQDEIRGAMDLATAPDPTPVKMEPADPGVATETVAFADGAEPSTNGSTTEPHTDMADRADDPDPADTADPTTSPASDPPVSVASDPAPMTTDGPPSSIAPSAEVAAAQLAVTQARLAAAQAELAEAEAKLAAARAERAVDLGDAAGVEPTDDAGSVPPGAARA
jgi:sec-independent protein translocase protein TatB